MKNNKLFYDYLEQEIKKSKTVSRAVILKEVLDNAKQILEQLDVCDCVIPKPRDPFEEISICRDCNGEILED